MDVTINISKDGVKTEFEVLLQKLGNSLEKSDNARAVFNLKSDRTFNGEDAHVVDKSFDKRAREAVAMMREFVTAMTDGTSFNVTLAMKSRWGGNADVLAHLVKEYVLDGMMYDWTSVTLPAQSAAYLGQMKTDREGILEELYSKKAPR